MNFNTLVGNMSDMEKMVVMSSVMRKSANALFEREAERVVDECPDLRVCTRPFGSAFSFVTTKNEDVRGVDSSAFARLKPRTQGLVRMFFRRTLDPMMKHIGHPPVFSYVKRAKPKRKRKSK